MQNVHKVARWLLLSVALGWALPAGGSEAHYRLGPQDRLRVKVHEWRPTVGEVHTWTAFDGEFTINTAGSVLLPLIGEVQAAGLKEEELANAISERLQATVGLVQRPITSLQIVQFRPFYVVGRVEKPGEYPYRPGLTVLQAVSIAGGMHRTLDRGLARLEAEAITLRGNLRVLGSESDALLARRARLQAEANGQKAVSFPPQLLQRSSDSAVGRILEEERLLFAARQENLRSQTESLGQIKALLEKEVESLRAKLELEDRQLSLLRKELDSVNILVAKGLTVAPRQLGLERTLAQVETVRIEVNTAILRARQEINKAERTAAVLKNKMQNEALVDLQLTQVKLTEATHKLQTTQRLIQEAEVDAPQQQLEEREREQEARPIYSIVRRSGADSSEMVAAETAAVEPGDIVKVERALPPWRRSLASSQARSSAAQTSVEEVRSVAAPTRGTN